MNAFRVLVCLIGWLIWATAGFSQELRGVPYVKQFVAKQVNKRNSDLASVETRLKEAEKSLVAWEKGTIRKGYSKVLPPTDRRPTAIFPNAAVKSAYIAAEKEKIIDLDTERRRLKNMTIFYPEFEKEMRPKDVGFFHRPMRVVRIVNESEMFVEYEGRDLLMKGVPTKDLADDSEFSPGKLFEVTGRHRDAIERTVFIVQPFDEKKLANAK